MSDVCIFMNVYIVCGMHTGIIGVVDMLCANELWANDKIGIH